jgi:CRP-like cAMP-binding protein
MGSEKRSVADLLVGRAAHHALLSEADEAALRRVPFEMKKLAPGEDVVRQGDKPNHAVFVAGGMLARYHTLPDGERQYLSLHIQGDMPDVQSLFLTEMDHSVCAMNYAEIALFPHLALTKTFLDHPVVAFAFWRMTLVDTAMFRQAITNNSARAPTARLAHFLCEQFARARYQGVAQDNSCDFPLNQFQLGQALGMAQISVNRAVSILRGRDLMTIRNAVLTIHDWDGLARVAGFDPAYLHTQKYPESALAGYRWPSMSGGTREA